MFRGLALFILIFSPTITYANVSITEIMYDLEGSDVKREWIEIYNGGTESVDLSDWRFNDGSNHTLSADDLIIDPGGYKLLVSDIETYGAGADVIDTVMSLNNSGDTLRLVREDGADEFVVTYSSLQGANGNGNSLQWIQNSWQEALPTPLMPNEEEEVAPVETEESEEGTFSEEQNVEEVFGQHVVSNIKARAGEDKQTVVGALTFFEGRALGLQNELLKNARYIWNLGDGSVKEGQNISHVYTYPGDYAVTLTVTSAELTATDRLDVHISKAKLFVSYADRGRIEISNQSTIDTDLSFWKLKYKDTYFTFPKNTIVAANRKAILPSSVTHLLVDPLQNVSLLYPNGLVAATYLVQVKQEELVTVLSTPTQQEKEVVVEYVYIEKEPEVDKDAELPLETATATPLMLQSANSLNSGGGMYTWLVGIVGLFSFLALILISLPKSIWENVRVGKKDSKKLTADDFTILQ